MADIKVSVIIPVYNAQMYLRKCLDSIIDQTLRDIEIICVDDGSTDGSWNILEEYRARDCRIELIRQENSGAGAARNRGLDAARGIYLSFLDSDDFFEPDMLELSYAKALEENSDIVVFGADIYWNDSGQYESVRWMLQKKRLPETHPFSGTDIQGNPFRAFIGWAWDKLFKTAFIKAGNYRFQEQRTTNDLLFVYSAIVDANRISLLDKVLAHQRRNVSGSLSVSRDKSWDCFYKALLALREHLKQTGKYDLFRRDFIDYSLHFSLWNINSLKGPSHKKLYNKLKNEWFAELGADSLASFDFEVKSEFRQYLHIKRTPYQIYKTVKAIFSVIQKIGSVLRCLKEHGFRYTMRRILEKARRIWEKAKIHILKKR